MKSQIFLYKKSTGCWLLLSYSLPARDGGGGAPLVCGGQWVCNTREREPETDPQGHWRAGIELWRAPAGHAQNGFHLTYCIKINNP